jgi:hypothetical protein
LKKCAAVIATVALVLTASVISVTLGLASTPQSAYADQLPKTRFFGNITGGTVDATENSGSQEITVLGATLTITAETILPDESYETIDGTSNPSTLNTFETLFTSLTPEAIDALLGLNYAETGETPVHVTPTGSAFFEVNQPGVATATINLAWTDSGIIPEGIKTYSPTLTTTQLPTDGFPGDIDEYVVSGDYQVDYTPPPTPCPWPGQEQFLEEDTANCYQTFSVAVINTDASKTEGIRLNEIIDIDAEAAPPGTIFDRWAFIGPVDITDINNPHTTAQIQGSGGQIEATYKNDFRSVSVTAGSATYVSGGSGAGTCNFSYSCQTTVGSLIRLLHDGAASGQHFVNWTISGADWSGTSSAEDNDQNAEEALDQAYFRVGSSATPVTATANFAPDSVKIVFHNIGDQNLTVTNPGNAVCSYDPPTGTDRTATCTGVISGERISGVEAAPSASGYEFDHWAMSGVSTDEVVLSPDVTWTQNNTRLTLGTNFPDGATYHVRPVYEMLPWEFNVVSAGTNANASGTSCSGTHCSALEETDEVSVTAGTPPSGLHFDHWEVANGNLTISDASSATTNVTVLDNDPAEVLSVQAFFVQNVMTVTVSSGSLFNLSSSAYADCASGDLISGESDLYSRCSGKVGDQFTITAEESPAGKHFKAWTISGATASLANITDPNAEQTTITLPNGAHEANVTVTATYEDNVYNLQIANGTASITGTANGASCSANICSSLKFASQVTITANEAPAYKHFDHWDISPSEGITVNFPTSEQTIVKEFFGDNNQTFSATPIYVDDTYEIHVLHVKSDPTGVTTGVICDPATGAGFEKEVTCSGAKKGNKITVVAADPEEGYFWSGWQVNNGDVTIQDKVNPQITVGEDNQNADVIEIEPIYSPLTFSAYIEDGKAKGGTGIGMDSEKTASCKSTAKDECDGILPDDIITLTANAAPAGTQFDHWEAEADEGKWVKSSSKTAQDWVPTSSCPTSFIDEPDVEGPCTATAYFKAGLSDMTFRAIYYTIPIRYTVSSTNSYLDLNVSDSETAACNPLALPSNCSAISPGSTISISNPSAGIPPGQKFVGWEVLPDPTFANVSPATSATATVTITSTPPNGQAITINAVYDDEVPGPKMEVNSVNGTVEFSYGPSTASSLDVCSSTTRCKGVLNDVFNISSNAPPAGKHFKEWKLTGPGKLGDKDDPETTMTFLNGADGAKVSVTATFEDNTYSISITRGTASGQGCIGANCAGVKFNSTITLIAGDAPVGQHFKDWQISPADEFDGPFIADATSPTTTLYGFGQPHGTSYTVVANYEPDTFDVHISHILNNPTGLTSGITCDAPTGVDFAKEVTCHNVKKGGKITVRPALPEDGWSWEGWQVTSGEATFTNAQQTTLTVQDGNADESTIEFEAYYEQIPLTVVVDSGKAKGGTGVGNNCKSSAKDECDGFLPGDRVTLTAATAPVGYYFDHWIVESDDGAWFKTASSSTVYDPGDPAAPDVAGTKKTTAWYQMGLGDAYFEAVYISNSAPPATDVVTVNTTNSILSAPTAPGASCSSTVCSGVALNSSVQIVAPAPAEFMRFAGWEVVAYGVPMPLFANVTPGNPATITILPVAPIGSTITVNAIFEEDTPTAPTGHAIRVDEDSGYISGCTPGPFNCSDVEEGSIVMLIAPQVEGKTFDSWEVVAPDNGAYLTNSEGSSNFGLVGPSDSPTIFLKMGSDDLTVVANYTEIPAPPVLAKSSISVVQMPGLIAAGCLPGISYCLDVEEGSVVTLYAPEVAGQDFVNWQITTLDLNGAYFTDEDDTLGAGGYGTGAPTGEHTAWVKMGQGDIEVKAEYTPAAVSHQITVEGGGTVFFCDPDIYTQPTLIENCGGFEENENVMLYADPDFYPDGGTWEFVGPTYGAIFTTDGTGTTEVIGPNTDVPTFVKFGTGDVIVKWIPYVEPDPIYTLTVTGGGVIITPSRANCPADPNASICQELYTDEVVTIIAPDKTADNLKFVNWQFGANTGGAAFSNSAGLPTGVSQPTSTTAYVKIGTADVDIVAVYEPIVPPEPPVSSGLPYTKYHAEITDGSVSHTNVGTDGETPATIDLTGVTVSIWAEHLQADDTYVRIDQYASPALQTGWANLINSLTPNMLNTLLTVRYAGFDVTLTSGGNHFYADATTGIATVSGVNIQFTDTATPLLNSKTYSPSLKVTQMNPTGFEDTDAEDTYDIIGDYEITDYPVPCAAGEFGGFVPNCEPPCPVAGLESIAASDTDCHEPYPDPTYNIHSALQLNTTDWNPEVQNLDTASEPTVTVSGSTGLCEDTLGVGNSDDLAECTGLYGGEYLILSTSAPAAALTTTNSYTQAHWEFVGWSLNGKVEAFAPNGDETSTAFNSAPSVVVIMKLNDGDVEAKWKLVVTYTAPDPGDPSVPCAYPVGNFEPDCSNPPADEKYTINLSHQTNWAALVSSPNYVGYAQTPPIVTAQGAGACADVPANSEDNNGTCGDLSAGDILTLITTTPVPTINEPSNWTATAVFDGWDFDCVSPGVGCGVTEVSGNPETDQTISVTVNAKNSQIVAVWHFEVNYIGSAPDVPCTPPQTGTFEPDCHDPAPETYTLTSHAVLDTSNFPLELGYIDSAAEPTTLIQGDGTCAIVAAAICSDLLGNEVLVLNTTAPTVPVVAGYTVTPHFDSWNLGESADIFTGLGELDNISLTVKVRSTSGTVTANWSLVVVADTPSPGTPCPYPGLEAYFVGDPECVNPTPPPACADSGQEGTYPDCHVPCTPPATWDSGNEECHEPCTPPEVWDTGSSSCQEPAVVYDLAMSVASSGTFTAATAGYSSRPSALNITVTNYDTAVIANAQVVAISQQFNGAEVTTGTLPFEVSGRGTTAPCDQRFLTASSTNTTCQVRPVLGLAVGTYTATLQLQDSTGTTIINTDGPNPGSPVQANVTFTVNAPSGGGDPGGGGGDNITKVPMYRAAKLNGAGYFYTTNYAEYLTVANFGMRPEGYSYSVSNSPGPGLTAVYRAAHLTNGGYFYTNSYSEYLTTPQYGYRPEGVAFYVPTSQIPGTQEVYRAAKFQGGYFYTMSYAEYLTVGNFGMRPEGSAWYAWS